MTIAMHTESAATDCTAVADRRKRTQERKARQCNIQRLLSFLRAVNPILTNSVSTDHPIIEQALAFTPGECI